MVISMKPNNQNSTNNDCIIRTHHQINTTGISRKDSNMITKHNYFISSQGIFKGCKRPKRKPDFISYSKYDGRISSEYWYGEDKNGSYVIRCSNHWSTLKDFGKEKRQIDVESISSCWWDLKTTSKKNIKTGKCYFKAMSIRYLSKYEEKGLC